MKPYLSLYLRRDVVAALATLQERQPGQSRSALIHAAIIAAVSAEPTGKGKSK